MSYLDIIPGELINEISLYLNYNESLPLKEKTKLNYEYFLSIKFPALYKIVKTIKQHDLMYTAYPYEAAYKLAYLQELYLKYDPSNESTSTRNRGDPIDYNNIYTDDIEIYLKTTWIHARGITGLTKLYIIYKNITTSTPRGKYLTDKYLYELPDVKDLDYCLYLACDDYVLDITQNPNMIASRINEYKFVWYTRSSHGMLYITNMRQLLEYYIAIRENPELLTRVPPTEKFDFDTDTIEERANFVIMYQFIFDYVTNKLKNKS